MDKDFDVRGIALMDNHRALVVRSDGTEVTVAYSMSMEVEQPVHQIYHMGVPLAHAGLPVKRMTITLEL